MGEFFEDVVLEEEIIYENEGFWLYVEDILLVRGFFGDSDFLGSFLLFLVRKNFFKLGFFKLLLFLKFKVEKNV